MAWSGGNRYISAAEMAGNAQEVADFFMGQGWSKNAISAMLGNMEAESGINPGIWEMLRPFWRGYGLTQWSPWDKYSNWATANGFPNWENNGPAECAMIVHESYTNEQWFRNRELGIDPPITMLQFTTSNLDIGTLSDYWLWFYEHPQDPVGQVPVRRANSQKWYNAIDWHGYDPGPGPGPGNIPPWMLFKFRR